jgi:hypothetical protein
MCLVKEHHICESESFRSYTTIIPLVAVPSIMPIVLAKVFQNGTAKLNMNTIQ